MANDPNRDLLPVKDNDDRSIRGVNSRADYKLLAKLKRCDLEDRYIKLYEENTTLKKQLNCQDEKIKRLSTKLLRLVDEKKSCAENYGRSHENKGLDELHMRVIELEHENYTLKDRNVVLKQQLANHARQHVAAHKSPNRSVHTSPRMSQRQSSAPNVNESNYIFTNRNHQSDVQLQEAEEHINELNNEIKSLHNKIDCLQQDLEKSSLENQKTKVCENIELIRLQRSLKQQSIHVASLQAQIKNSERCQKLLKDELGTAHKENEESLQLISDKQKEILDLYTKLEEKNVTRLEQEEMRERINDLTIERDSLKERGEFLMKSIEAKSNEADVVKELRTMLAVEKSKKEELKLSLENTQKVLQSLKKSDDYAFTSDNDTLRSPFNGRATTELRVLDVKKQTVGSQTSISLSSVLNKSGEDKLQLLTLTQFVSPKIEERTGSVATAVEQKVLNVQHEESDLFRKSVGTLESYSLKCSATNLIKARDEITQTDSSLYNEDQEKIKDAEKINLERELEYIRQMLRGQTQRCDAQEFEINRLNNELRSSEEKYYDTLKRLDIHLKIFQNLETRTSFMNDAEQRTLQQNFDSGDNKNGDKDVESDDRKENLTIMRSKNSDSFSARRVSNESLVKEETLSSDTSEFTHSNPGQFEKSGHTKDPVETRPVPKPRKDVARGSSEGFERGKLWNALNGAIKESVKLEENITMSVDWLKLEPDTCVWQNDNIKLLFVDFSFLDMKGEETETPTSLTKPNQPTEKCHYNFTKNIIINDHRRAALTSLINQPDSELIVFKIVSEPEESGEDSECIDIGVATVTVKQFFESKPNNSLLLQVKNVNDSEEVIGILSISLDISAIS